MKKTILIAFLSVLVASCSGRGGSSSSDTDSVAAAQPETEAAEDENVACITGEGVGGIWIGQSVNDVPDSIPGLYDTKENGSSPDAVAIVFKNKGDERFVAYDFGEGKIDVINLIDSSVKVKTPQGEFGLGDKFSKVLELPGLEEEWSGYDNTGMWYWKWEGLWFAPSQETVSDHLSRRLFQSVEAPTRADFDDNVTIGFIGTGLPF